LSPEVALRGPCVWWRKLDVMTGKRLPPWLTGVVMFGGFLTLAWLERRRPLRRPTEPKVRREIRNLAIAALGSIVIQGLETPLVNRLTGLVERRRWGLLKQRRLAGWVEVVLGVVLLDYSMYWWHRLNHIVPVLWRTHLPHHVDLDLDASTALRFHFTELLASLPLRALQIAGIGAGPLAFSIWQTLFALSILFHHSDLELVEDTERRLLWLVVTPRMHGIHHSTVRAEADANLSSGLSFWDRLHGTLRVNIPQRELTIGVPAYRDPVEVTFSKVLAMPFAESRDDWRLPGGEVPQRTALTGDPQRICG